MARPGGELAIAHGAQFAAQGLLGDDNAELLPHPLAQIDQSPTHDAMGRRDRAAFDDGLQRAAMHIGQSRRLARWLAVNQAIRALRIELHHPVPNDLQGYATDLGGLRPRRTLVDRRQREQPASLPRVLARAGAGAQAGGIKIGPDRDWHREPPSFATLNHARAASGNPLRVTPSGTRYYLLAEAGLHKGQAYVVDVGELARYDRPMPTMAEYDVLLSAPCVGTA